MAYDGYDTLWRSDFYNNVTAKDRTQDLNHLKLKVIDTYKKDEKITTNFEPTDDTDVKKTAYLDTKLSKIEVQVSYIEKDNNEFKLLSNKRSVEEALSQKTVRTTIQTFYDKQLFDKYDNKDEVLKTFLLVRDVHLIYTK